MSNVGGTPAIPTLHHARSFLGHLEEYEEREVGCPGDSWAGEPDSPLDGRGSQSWCKGQANRVRGLRGHFAECCPGLHEGSLWAANLQRAGTSGACSLKEAGTTAPSGATQGKVGPPHHVLHSGCPCSAFLL